ncbi:MAG: hypothetical protein C0415_05955 [Thermodesulfovibrio sp.]|nr:hypothetical protein [Thermodesulfovibrio sp.]
MTHKHTWFVIFVVLIFSFIALSVVTAEDKQDKTKAPEVLGGSKVEMLEKRLDAISGAMGKMADEIMQWRSQEKCQSIGCNCRLERQCVNYTCCRWGPPGNGGTASCLEQCCGAWEYVFKCY